MILPVIIKIVLKDGHSQTVQLPIEVWQRGGTWVYKYASTGKIDKVILDPENVLPDMNRANNEINMPE